MASPVVLAAQPETLLAEVETCASVVTSDATLL